MQENEIIETNSKGKFDYRKILLFIGPALVLIAAIILIVTLGQQNTAVCEDDIRLFANPKNFPVMPSESIIEKHDYLLSEEMIYTNEQELKNYEDFYDSNGVLITNGGAIRDAYAEKHALDKRDLSFKDVNYNQLFDGVIACAYGPNSNAYLLEEGVVIDMGRKLQNYQNIVFDFDFSAIRFSMEITVSYYRQISSSPKQYEEFSFTFLSKAINRGGGNAYMMSFYPEEIMPVEETLAGCSIMAFRYSAEEAVTIMSYEEISALDNFLTANFLKL